MTAVEFIIEQLAKNGVLHSSDIAKAKEMEKEQIVRAIDNVYFDKDGNEMTGEDYYNTTFKSE